MLAMGGLAADPQQGARLAQGALDSGEAAERFGRMAAALGGPRDLLERPAAYLAPAPVVRPVFPARGGVLAGVDCRLVGLAVVELGGGRRTVEDKIDPRVGFTELAAVGETVGPERPLAMVHAATPEAAELAAAQLQAACKVEEAAETRPAVLRRLTSRDPQP
jgi:thymidine phosphorylase